MIKTRNKSEKDIICIPLYKFKRESYSYYHIEKEKDNNIDNGR